MYNELARNSFDRAGNPLCLYGDPAYPLRVHLQAPFRNAALTQTRTRIPSPRRLFVNLKKSSFVKNQEDVLLVKVASLSPLYVLTPVSGFPAYRLANCGLSGTNSPMNSCHSPILSLYSLNMTCVLLTIPSARSPRTPVDLFEINHNPSWRSCVPRLRQGQVTCS